MNLFKDITVSHLNFAVMLFRNSPKADNFASTNISQS